MAARAAVWLLLVGPALAAASGRLPLQQPAADPAAAAAPGGWWRPASNTAMQYQLGQLFDIKKHVIRGVTAYAIDGEGTPAVAVKAMLARGLKPVCYFSAGSHEEWRQDASQFPAEAIGNALDGWQGEAWLDIRHPRVRAIMEQRIAMCKAKGFVAVDPGNVDGYANDSGFDLSADDQLGYNRWLADTAHKYGLGAGLKNDVDQLAELQPAFDFAINEQCAIFKECGRYKDTFVAAKKFVLQIEYTDGMSLTKFTRQVCPAAAANGITAIYKRQGDGVALDFYRRACPGRA